MGWTELGYGVLGVGLVFLLVTLGAVIYLLARLWRLAGAVRSPDMDKKGKVAFYGSAAYAISPIDLLPDPFLIDDIGLLLWAIPYVSSLAADVRKGNTDGLVERTTTVARAVKERRAPVTGAQASLEGADQTPPAGGHTAQRETEPPPPALDPALAAHQRRLTDAAAADRQKAEVLLESLPPPEKAVAELLPRLAASGWPSDLERAETYRSDQLPMPIRERLHNYQRQYNKKFRGSPQDGVMVWEFARVLTHGRKESSNTGQGGSPDVYELAAFSSDGKIWATTFRDGPIPEDTYREDRRPLVESSPVYVEALLTLAEINLWAKNL